LARAHRSQRFVFRFSLSFGPWTFWRGERIVTAAVASPFFLFVTFPRPFGPACSSTPTRPNSPTRIIPWLRQRRRRDNIRLLPVIIKDLTRQRTTGNFDFSLFACVPVLLSSRTTAPSLVRDVPRLLHECRRRFRCPSQLPPSASSCSGSGATIPGEADRRLLRPTSPCN
jgi:hypothetical protein